MDPCMALTRLLAPTQEEQKHQSRLCGCCTATLNILDGGTHLRAKVYKRARIEEFSKKRSDLVKETLFLARGKY